MKYLNIGLAGQLGNGKDVMAAHLIKRLSQYSRWRQLGFAHAVKKVFMDTFQVEFDWIEHWKRIPEPPPGFDMPIRQCLTTIGDGFRKMKSKIWIELAFREQTCHQVISDVRYLNEVNYINELGGFSVLIWRPHFENDMPNDSEQQLMPFVNQLKEYDCEGFIEDPEIPFRFFVINNGTLDDLYSKVDEWIIPYALSKLEENS